ncbi:hypothetical protein PHLCEN_2v9212 [Hermanssonia centrifuga]|uniref:Tyrosine-protein kinase catalytic domain-containing protein n=1 Tax=Hermanssonia centrifuga TaxID=98765 RepID=A0A2R6NRH9_9APHY|nr:hypothetical protein PHLCEN_2v9212 [Hermanssonia centrifuga]
MDLSPGQEHITFALSRSAPRTQAFLDLIEKVFRREAAIWRHLKHSNVLPFLGIDDSLFPGATCMVSPWMRNGSLQEYSAARDRPLLDSEVHRLMYDGRKPFKDRKSYQILAAVLHGERPPRNSSQRPIPDQMWKLMSACWAQQHDIRPTASIVKRYLAIGWYRSPSSLKKAVQPKLELHPLLLPQPALNHFIDNSCGSPFLIWNMLLPPDKLNKPNTCSHRVWMEGRYSAATWPRVGFLKFTSRHFPWELTVTAGSPEIGLTCGDVIEQIYSFMNIPITQQEQDGASPRQRIVLSNTYWRNRAEDSSFLSPQQEVSRCDWLGPCTMFGGLMEVHPGGDSWEGTEDEQHPIFELKCTK